MKSLNSKYKNYDHKFLQCNRTNYLPFLDLQAIKNEIADIPIGMLSKLLDAKEANLFLHSYMSAYLEQIEKTNFSISCDVNEL